MKTFKHVSSHAYIVCIVYSLYIDFTFSVPSVNTHVDLKSKKH